MARPDANLRHAISPPAFDRTKLHRERLVDAVHANIPRKLIAIAAPPGYGKTTLLSDFAAHTEIPTCWVRVTEADRDLMRLAEVLAASLQRRFRRLRGQPDLAAFVQASPAALARAFTSAIEERVGEPLAIVFDDVHILNRSRPVLEFLDVFLETQPEQITVLVAGREVPEVSLARLMAEGDLAGLGPQDLAMDREELISLARQLTGLQLGEVEADRLLEETRGWVTGLLLTGALTSTGLRDLVRGGKPMVYEYLASVVLNRQPDDLRRFILDASVLGVMTADACDAVMQRSDSHRYLARLMRESLFISATDESPRTYEFHPQFREFLLESLGSAGAARLRSLRLRAAEYLAEVGSLEDAVQLYFDAGSFRAMAGLMEASAQRMLRLGRTQTLELWVRMIEQAGTAAPRVLLYSATAYADQGNPEAAEQMLAKLERASGGKATASLRAGVQFVRTMVLLQRGEYAAASEAAAGAASISQGKVDRRDRATLLRLRALAILRGGGPAGEAEALATEAVALLEKEDDAYALGVTLLDLVQIQYAAGKSLEAFATSRRAHELLLTHGGPLPLSTSYNNLAVASHVNGEYEEALDLFPKALRLTRQTSSPAREANVLYGQADLFSDLGLALQAAELYGQGLQIATRLDNPALIRYGCVQTSVLHRRRGGPAVAHEWLKRAMALEKSGSPDPMVRTQLAALEVSVSPPRARSTLRELLDESRRPLDSDSRTLALYHLARAEVRDGNIQAAQSVFDQALAWAATRGREQLLAAELSCDADTADFARRFLGAQPVLPGVLRRVELMQAVARRFQDNPPEERQSEQLVVRALGKGTAHWNGRSLGDLKPLVREILFYLVDAGQADRDVIVETFWPHYPPGRQTANLHMTVYGLRRILGKDAVLLEGTTYSLAASLKIDSDVQRFERAAEVAERLPPGDPRRLFALTEAINSYQGSYLADSPSSWVVQRRRGLESRYLDLLTANAEEAMVRDLPARAVTTLRKALQIDPLRDDLHMTYLEALGRMGRRSEVITHYQYYVRLLADELGLDPPSPVRELYARLIG
jgi:LuxR family maltose regulon positive regulatory protein